MSVLPRTTDLGVAIGEELLARWPDLHCGWLAAEVAVRSDTSELARELDRTAKEIVARETLETIASHPVIAATRALYRACGKDPSRYRPAAEQLRRRAVRGLGPWPVAPLVDLVNLASLRTGLSMSGCDLDAIEGPIVWGVGRGDEPYEAIGRGWLNIEGLPVWRDAVGAFASPTSDSVRTRLRPETARVLVLVHGPAQPQLLQDALCELAKAFQQYFDANRVAFTVI